MNNIKINLSKPLRKKSKILAHPFLQLSIFTLVFVISTIVPLFLVSTSNGKKEKNGTIETDNVKGSTKSSEDSSFTVFDDIYQYLKNVFLQIEKLELDHWILIITFCTFSLMLLDFIIGKKKIRNSLIKLFWRLAFPLKLKRFKKSLRNEYFLIDLPFSSEARLTMAEVFIPLKAEEKSTNSKLTLKSIIRNNKSMIITGAPGSGKSLLCKNIIYNYSINNLDSVKKKAIPIYIRLHKYDGNFQIIDEVFSSITQIALNSDFIEKLLYTGGLLFLFDGFDEVRNSEKRGDGHHLKIFYEKISEMPIYNYLP